MSKIKKILIGTLPEMRKIKSKKFVFKEGKSEVEGFAVYHKGKVYAYINRCKHVSIPLDFGDNDFFTDDRKFLLCKNHGALYRPDTGECVAGPCSGAYLDSLPTELIANKIYCKV